MISGRYFLSAILALGTWVGVDGFITPSSTAATVRATTTPLHVDATGWDNFCIEDENNRGMLQANNPEVARRFRRTVYTHEDWKKHRRQDRFVIYLGSMFKSGVFENSKNEVLLTTAIAAFVCFYNTLVGGYTDFAGVSHPGLLPGQVIGLPMTAFTLTGSSLGLLLSKLCFFSSVAHYFIRSIDALNLFYLWFLQSQPSVPTPLTSVGTKLERTGE